MSDERQQVPEKESADAPETGDAEVLEWPAPGTRLRRLREEQNLTQSEVAESLRLTVHYINALEEDNYGKLPGQVFVKGYIRAYATLLGGDAEELVKVYENYMAGRGESRQQAEKVLERRQRRDQTRLWLLGAAGILVIFVGLSWWFSVRNQEDVTRVATPAVPVPAEEAETVVERTDPLATERTGDLPVAVESPQSDGATTAAPAPIVGSSAGSPDEFRPAALMLPDSDAVREPEEASGVPIPAEEASPSQLDEAEPEPEQEPTFSLTTESVEDGRLITLEDAGEDVIEILSFGTSWIEVDNGEGQRLFNDIMSEGDELLIRSRGPFELLIGDARQIVLDYNREPIDLDSFIRSDNSARVTLEDE